MGRARTARRATTAMLAVVLVLGLAACDPPAPPTVTVTPSTGVLDEGLLKVGGTVTRGAGRTLRVQQIACDTTDPSAPVCTDGPSVTTTVGSDGRYAASLRVRRFVGQEECGRSRYPVPDCYVRVVVLRADGTTDSAVAPSRSRIWFGPAAPAFVASPTTGLADRAVVQIRFDDDERAGVPVKVQQRVCDRSNPQAPVCTTAGSVRTTLDADGRATVSLTVRRSLGGMDCARTSAPTYECELEALVVQGPSGPPDRAYDGTRVRIRFAPA